MKCDIRKGEISLIPETPFEISVIKHLQVIIEKGIPFGISWAEKECGNKASFNLLVDYEEWLKSNYYALTDKQMDELKQMNDEYRIRCSKKKGGEKHDSKRTQQWD